MAVNLSSTSSIIDYLSLKGKDSSFGARQKLYNDLGLNTRLGDYTGSPNQNVNLLNTLKSQPTSPPSTDYGSLFSSAAKSISTILGQNKSVPAPTGYNPDTGVPLTPTSPYFPQQPANPQNPPSSPAPIIPPPQEPTPPPETPASSAVDTSGQSKFSATDALSALGMSNIPIPTADEALKQVTESPAYQNYLESIGLKSKASQASAEAKKQSLDEAAVEKAQEINQSYGQRGLYFSGMRPEDLRKLSESLATSKLGVDRQLAVDLLQNNIDVRDRIFTDVQKIIDTAITNSGNARKNAIDQINKLGYAVVGDQILPIPQKTDFSSFKSVQGGLYDASTGQWVIKPKSGEDPLSTYQRTQTFLNISNQYQNNAVIKQAVNGQTVEQLADQIIAAPDKATNQLASLYILVKNLDPTSAVREGELALANQTQSYLQKFENTLARINTGQPIAPEAAKNLALATKSIAKAWYNTAATMQQAYQSQANVAGVGSEFSNFLGGYKSKFASPTPSESATSPVILSDLDFKIK